MSNITLLSDLEPLYELRRKVDNQQRLYRSNAEDQCYQLDRALSQLEEFTRDLLDLGIVVINANNAVMSRQLNMDLLAYCKKIQKQLSRPFVTMVHHDQGRIGGIRIWSHWELTMPTALADLAAPMLVVSKHLQDIPDDPGRYSMDDFGCVFHSLTGKANRHWRFWFLLDTENNKAEDIRTGWLEFCRSDNLCRRQLKMPYNPVDMSVYRSR